VGMGLGDTVGANGNGNGKRAESPGEESSGSTTEKSGRRQVVLVVSAGTETNRPQVAANFAAVYAEAGQRAVVISTAELGRGRLAEPTGAVRGDVEPEDVESRLEPSRIENVLRLPLSDFVDNSGQLVTRAPAVIEAARSVADVIVVEAPPLLAVHHAEALSHAVDVVLLVGECWDTTYDDARRAGDLLRRMDAPVLGIVLTNVRISRRDIRHAHASLRGVPESDLDPTADPTGQPVSDLTAAGAGTTSQA
jgi:protein-tyrosine kinase